MVRNEGGTGRTSGGPVVYRWHYDDTGHYAYVLLDADEKIRDVVCRRLRARGIEPLVSGASRRPANDGKAYDFFVRVSRQGSEENDHPEPEAVARAFSGLPQFAPGPSAPSAEPVETAAGAEGVSDDPARLRHELETERQERLAARGYAREMREKVSRLTHEVERERSRSAERLDAMRKGFENERASFERRVAVLRRAAAAETEGISAASAEASRGRLEELGEEIAELTSKLAAANDEVRARDSDMRDFYAEWGAAQRDLDAAIGDYVELSEDSDASRRELENRLSMVSYEKENLLAQMAELHDQLGGPAAEVAGSVPKASSKDVESLYGRLLACLVPSLSLQRGSVAVLATEFRDNGKALETLRKLDADPGAIGSESERVEKAPGWSEVRFTVGRDGNVGRIYYLRPKKGEGPCRVLIGHKGRQDPDIKWLKRNT